MKRTLKILLIILLVLPISVFGLTDDYQDIVSEYTNDEVITDVLNIYIFHGDGCPHCKKALTWLDKVEKEYEGKIKIIKYEVWKHPENASILFKLYDHFKVKKDGVPFIVIGDKYFQGYDDNGVVESEVQSAIDEYILGEQAFIIHLPILGNVDKRNISLPLVAVILGFIDGFNPCAMWILLFLINMFINSKNNKKSWILGSTFLFTSGLIYFLSMFGISTIISVAASNLLKKLLAIFIIGAGLYNTYSYFKTRKMAAGCNVVDKTKRKKIMTKINQILNEKSFILAMIGIITLAVSINLIELACSLGFPVIFTSLLAFNHVTGLTKFIYLLIYIIFYMIDDMAVFTISMITLNATGITNKYNKACKIISAIIMLIIGIILLLKPDWLMFNF